MIYMDDEDDECRASRTRTQSVLLYQPSIREIHVPRNKDPFIFSFQIKKGVRPISLSPFLLLVTPRGIEPLLPA